MRVLIADDHDLLRDTLVMFLQAQGDIETSAAADLAGACKLIETEERYDLVLLDLNKPTPVTPARILSKCGWSPFEGTTFRSSVDTTIVSGQIAFQNGTVEPAVRGQRLVFDR